ncbi:Uncharacterised protein [Rhodococcus rhodochrous]|nr:Uncharacterised protein [Rhodococcus rhodochrous]
MSPIRAAVPTAFAYTGYPKIVIESVPEDVTSVTTGVLATTRQAFSAISVAIVSVMLSLWTVPDTTMPTSASLDLAVGWFVLCSLIVAAICLFIGRPQQAPAVDSPVSDGRDDADMSGAAV